ncbi:MAG: L-alanine-DL-glutamate epimerase [Candidatus Latescibacterota bacterium]|nr:L-alanine-DL-glutamate epimerase [Candidatus Latescibacterota bacterium]
MKIVDYDLDIQREPFAKPFAFKGSAFHEKWNLVVRLQGDDGGQAFGVGGLAALWSDSEVFAAHSEIGGNALMVAILERALACSRDREFTAPPELLAAILPEVQDYAGAVTGRGSKLLRTFTLNACVALDLAAWTLWSRRCGVDDFDGLVPDAVRPALAHRQQDIALVPAVAYNTPPQRVEEILAEGAAILKVKIGHPGNRDEMISGDCAGLRRISELIVGAKTPFTKSGEVGLYLDANGRFRDLEAVNQVLDAAGDAGLLERTLLLEEPFAADVHAVVGDLPVPVAADESLHDPAEVKDRQGLGYSAVAIKPAGKTLSIAFDMIAEVHRCGLAAFVADNACVPWLVEWNKAVAARLPAFPGVRGGMMESNGPENYGSWSRMLTEHPCAGASWLRAERGAFRLDDDYYDRSGGIFLDPQPYCQLLR